MFQRSPFLSHTYLWLHSILQTHIHKLQGIWACRSSVWLTAVCQFHVSDTFFISLFESGLFFKFHFFVSTYHQKLSNCLIDTSGFLGCANGKGSTCQCRRRGFDPWVGKIPWRRAWQPTPVFLPGESHGQRSLAGYSPPGRQESDTAEHTHTHTHTDTCVTLKSRFFGLCSQGTRLPSQGTW